MRSTHVIIASLSLILACSRGSDSSPRKRPPLQIAVEFTRNDQPGLDPFTVTATVTRRGNPLPGQTVDFTAPKGSISPVTDLGDGRYTVVVTPSATGEHPVTVSTGNASISRTALVLLDVHPDWGQPMEVPGLVNTEGYEDGVTITPDGEYLFVQTGPFYWSGLVVFLTPRAQGGAGGDRLSPTEFHHPWMDDLIGPYRAPERPDFFDGRFSGTQFLHNANSWGVGINQAPNWAMSTMFYGFKRQADGSFAEPFYLAPDDENDGLGYSFGLGIRMNGDGTARIVYSLDMPSDLDDLQVDVNGDGFGGPDDVGSGFDLYTLDVTLGQDTILGTFTATGIPGTAPRKDTPFPSVPVTLGNVGTDGIFGTQGNVAYFESAGQVILFTDDEYDTGGDQGEISVYVQDSGVFPAGTWTKTILPSNINTADEEIQPYFDGQGMFFTRLSGPEVYFASYSGPHTSAGYGDNANWSIPERLLAKDTALTIGAIIALGEPTTCTYQGDEYLYFVYALVRSIDASGPTTFYDIDMNAGYVRKR